MRNSVVSVILCLLGVGSILAADNTKQIDNVLRNFAELTEKANETRAKSIDKARTEAISQLTKLAGRAYTEKDRISENRAWKTILKLDRKHPKAAQYFKDLGTLDKILAEIPVDSTNTNDPRARFIGKWQVVYSAGTSEIVDIRDDGTITFLPKGLSQKYTFDSTQSDVCLISPNAEAACLNRYTLAGNKLLVEQWSSLSADLKTSTSVFGRAERLE